MIRLSLEQDVPYTIDLAKRLDKYSISQSELAQESGIAESQISRMLVHGVQPQLKNVVRIEDALARLRKRRRRTK